MTSLGRTAEMAWRNDAEGSSNPSSDPERPGCQDDGVVSDAPGGTEDEGGTSAPIDPAVAASAPRTGRGLARAPSEEALSEASALGLPELAALVAGAPDAIIILDERRCFVYANPAALELFARSMGELRGRDFLLLFPAREQARFREPPRPLARPYRATVCRPDGSEREVVISPLGLETAAAPHSVAFVRDVTAERDAAHTAAALAQTAAQLVGSASVEEITTAITRQAVEGTQAVACGIAVADEDDKLVFAGGYGYPPTWREAHGAGTFSLADVPGGQTLLADKPVVLPDATTAWESNPATRSLGEAMGSLGWRAAVHVPLSWRDHVFGILGAHLPPRADPPSETDLAFYTALADQAAVAVMNARLAAQASQVAASLERTRLARELHDSVSQALFSTTLQARAAQRSMAATGLGDDSPLGRSVVRLVELTRGALAEMRALILELRPGALGEEGLVSALRKQAAALSSREQVAITVEGPDERLAIDPEVEEHLYRIMSEALHNVVKHAQAETATVVIAPAPGTLEVTVSDHGAGFDTTKEHRGHLGLSTMGERAEAIGAKLAVISAPGAGTTVRVSVPLDRGEPTEGHPDGG